MHSFLFVVLPPHWNPKQLKQHGLHAKEADLGQREWVGVGTAPIIQHPEHEALVFPHKAAGITEVSPIFYRHDNASFSMKTIKRDNSQFTSMTATVQVYNKCKLL